MLARLPYINPTPAAEAKLLAQRAEHDRLWQEKRAAVHQRRLGEGEALAARAGSGRGVTADNCMAVETGGIAMGQQAAAFLAGLLAPPDNDEDAEGDAGGQAAGGQARTGHTADSSERGAPAMRGGSDSSDDEPTGQRAATPREAPSQTTNTDTGTEVVRGKAGERKARRVRTDSQADGNRQGASAEGNENDSDGKAKAKERRTATRGRVYRIGSLVRQWRRGRGNN